MSTNTSDRLQLFLMVQGISSKLTLEQAAANHGMGQVPTYWDAKVVPPEIVIPGIVPYLQQTQFPNASFFVYSYRGSLDNGNPLPYDCTETFSHPLKDDILTFGTQMTRILKHNPNFIGRPTDVYIIGHSLGGVVAFGYLASLNHTRALTSSTLYDLQARLKGVVTLDSPIGGVTGNKRYQGLIKDAAGRPKGCPEIKNLPSLPSVDDLVQIFATNNGDGHPQGAEASLSKALFQRPGPAVSNQALAELSARVGIPVLTIGNTSDLFWDPSICTIDGDFRTTQWVQDRAGQLAVYGRDFTAGVLRCNPDDFLPNHEAALHNPIVEAALNQFFPSGEEPTALTVAPADLPTALTTASTDL